VPSSGGGGGDGGPGTAGIPARIFTALGQLLEYPRQHPGHAAEALHEQLRDDFPKAAKALAGFIKESRALTVEQLEEIYARAFDISPLAVPYIGIYLFGEDDRKRARFMAGLKICFDDAGRDLGGELPDHLGVVLRQADVFRPEDWEDLVTWCLHGPIKAMRQGLDRADNPYRHVLHAIQQVFATLYPEEFKSC
jgi:nitrate reductase assembly molybdenum cofactor insertion protein NarJ